MPKSTCVCVLPMVRIGSFTAFPSNGVVTTASGKYIAVAVKDGSNKCVASGVVAAVVGS